ncbi:MAG: hypothetical protein WBR18_13930 [Anaerolineales bacterium]
MIRSVLELALALTVLMVFQRLLHRHLQGTLYLITRNQTIALGLYAVLFLPGVFLHEGSHYLVASILRVPTHGFSLFPHRVGKMVRLGYVETAAADPIRASLIGLAPLATGVVAILILALDHLGLGDLASAVFRADMVAMGQAFGHLVATPDLVLWLYLVFAISNTMIPSKSDRAAWLPAIGLLVAMVVLLWLVGVGGSLADQLGPMLESAASRLSGVFGITAGIDTVLLLPILALEALLARLLGLQVVY